MDRLHENYEQEKIILKNEHANLISKLENKNRNLEQKVSENIIVNYFPSSQLTPPHTHTHVREGANPGVCPS